jgi:hypothetical protein
MQRKSLSDYAENACLDKSNPQGPLHPRVFLLLFYRADALAAMHAAGQIASPDAPSDWDSLVGLLKAHSGALHANGAASSISSLLPTHGLCITTDASCGRLGDVLAAIAASVVQTSGTKQVGPRVPTGSSGVGVTRTAPGRRGRK